MAILIEGISVVIRADALLAAFANSWEAFKETVLNKTLCADGELVRVGFMSPDDVQQYVQMLEARGLRYVNDGRAMDMVVIDQQKGAAIACDWIDFGQISLDNDGSKCVAACRLNGSTSRALMKPDGWQYEMSLSSQYGFSPSEADGRGLRFLRREEGLDVYWSELSGKEVFVGRSGKPRA